MPFVRQLLAERPTAIFDLGPPMSQDCIFLSKPGIQVYWDNTVHSLSHSFHGPRTTAVTQPSLPKGWTPPNIRAHIDLVLAWNYFDYLDPEDIKRLFSELNRHFVMGSRFYFLIHHCAEISKTAPVFQVERDDVLRYTMQPPYRAAPRYPPKMIEQMMPGFEIEKLYLMSNGLQEHLFRKKF